MKEVYREKPKNDKRTGFEMKYSRTCQKMVQNRTHTVSPSYFFLQKLHLDL